MMSAKEPLRITREDLRALSEKDILYAAGARIMLQRGDFILIDDTSAGIGEA